MQPTSLGTTRQTLIKSSSAFSHKHLASVDEMSQWNLSGPYCSPLLLHLLERAFSFHKTLHCSSTSPPLCYRVPKQAHTYHWSFRNATMWRTQRTWESACWNVFDKSPGIAEVELSSSPRGGRHLQDVTVDRFQIQATVAEAWTCIWNKAVFPWGKGASHLSALWLYHLLCVKRLQRFW